MKVLPSIFSWRALAYLFYALMLIGVLLYVRFPTEKFKVFCENRLGILLPAGVCTIDRIDYNFPLTLNVDGIRISRGDAPRHEGFFIDTLSLVVNPANLGKTAFLSAIFYGGKFSARLETDFTGQTIRMQGIQLTGLRLAELVKGPLAVDRTIEGIAAFEGDYQAGFMDLLGGVGKGRGVIKTGSIDLLQPVLSLRKIDFTEAGCTVDYENKRMEIAEGKLQGKDMTAEFSGELRLGSSMTNTQWQLGGALLPSAVFLQTYPQEAGMVQAVMQRYHMTALPFKIGGTLKNPTVRFGL